MSLLIWWWTGAGLARSEVAIMIEEWTKRIPEIGVDPDRGMVNGMLELHLVWPR